ncbi:MAG: RNA methyltransferase [Vicingaceae bacterium]|jgi:23S rRNA (guanosine2251-2'-O)-methyltransferase|tara:strand:+ start:180 stop:716 length:537 start_codon:yes stop_codon:yes gene_type:complete
MNRKLANDELGRIDLERFKIAEKTPIVVVLDNIRSLNNIGSVFRTSDAMAIEAVYLCGITAKPPHREINKTALGATESVVWEYFDRTELAVEKLKDKGYTIVSIEQTENSTYLNDYKVKKDQKLAIIMGHEVNGVAQEIIDLSDDVIEIPQKGTKHSLNISVTTGVVLWDLCSKFEKL